MQEKAKTNYFLEGFSLLVPMRQRTRKFSYVLKILTFLSIFNLNIQILVPLVYKVYVCKLWRKNNRSVGPTLISHAVYIVNSDSVIYIYPIADAIVRWLSVLLTPKYDGHAKVWMCWKYGTFVTSRYVDVQPLSTIIIM